MLRCSVPRSSFACAGLSFWPSTQRLTKPAREIAGPLKGAERIPARTRDQIAAFFDGHATLLRNSAIFYNLPRTNGAILWAKNNNGPNP